MLVDELGRGDLICVEEPKLGSAEEQAILGAYVHNNWEIIRVLWINRKIRILFMLSASLKRCSNLRYITLRWGILFFLKETED